MKPTNLVVVVLYQQPIEKTPSFALLSQAVLDQKIQLVIFDNSPTEQHHSLFEKKFVNYYHDAQNPGLAAAYNYALSQAQPTIQRLITLDQDTVLNESYLEQISQVEFSDDCVVAVPMIFDQGQQISPVYADQYVNRTYRAVSEVGLTEQRVMAINSGTVFSISFLQTIGGFNPAFSLDFLDHWFFWKVYQLHKKIEILPIRLEHDLSVLNYEKVSTTRYESILAAETKFYREYDQIHWKKHRKQLLLRSIKQFLTVKNRKIWRSTLRVYVEMGKV
ncbi:MULTISPECIES: glycosyltransferase [Enterococcus]|uniref:glycosyltransferase n=1 Tax=Enterococcus TaxID=1350 RepID=UPI002891CC43|nr:glycosyltransferase [Enterococcus thailandicus]MDT2752417.1 glycosyltransferase [Enterococcus thailandicus]MDT2776912.1 glycosyltransferase [Enterococcus thailandicus]MDT2793322.1 glycosyltransferase [Enterococcus thailandicus]